MKVLVVDDEPTLRHLIKTNLDFEGFDTLTAANGAEALEVIAREHPDVVLLDVMMPVLDGWGVLSALNEDPEGSPRVILVSALARDHLHVRGWELGCTEYITKPFDFDDLIARIRNVSTVPS